jgi:hypothetical protein
MDALNTMITSLTTQMQALVVPLGILGLVLWGIAILVTPLLPEWASGMRGYFRTAMLVVGFIGFVPGIIAALAAMGGA